MRRYQQPRVSLHKHAQAERMRGRGYVSLRKSSLSEENRILIKFAPLTIARSNLINGGEEIVIV